MMLQTAFSFKKLTICSIAVLGLCFWAENSMAQSERDKSEMEREKPTDKPIVENQFDQIEIQNNDSPTSTTVGTATSSKNTLQKKDTQLSGEGKKVESIPSTLSFNIFLYIVDKFKAD